MANGKKGFIAYADWIELFEVLPDEKAGQLIKHIFKYVNDQNPKTDDLLINATFAVIKQTLKRDLKKWEEERKKRSEAGKKGMASRRSNDNNDIESITNDNSVKDDITKITDSVSVSVSVSDSVNVKEKKRYGKFVSLSDDEYQKLIDTYPEQAVLDKIEDLNIYCGSKGKRYKDYYLTLLGRLKKDYKDFAVPPKKTNKQIMEEFLAEQT